MAENIENKGFAVYNAETNRTGDEAMDAKTRKNIEYLIILLISAAVLAVGWSNRKTIAIQKMPCRWQMTQQRRKI